MPYVTLSVPKTIINTAFLIVADHSDPDSDPSSTGSILFKPSSCPGFLIALTAALQSHISPSYSECFKCLNQEGNRNSNVGLNYINRCLFFYLAVPRI